MYNENAWHGGISFKCFVQLNHCYEYQTPATSAVIER